MGSYKLILFSALMQFTSTALANLCNSRTCGQNTQCEVVGTNPTCKCLPGYYGSPIAGCHDKCDSDADCGSQYTCIEYKCQNACSLCGANADCKIVQNIPICKCPNNFTGNPSVSCRPFEKKDLCEPNPCGANAGCEPGYDKSNQQRPVCTCFSGYTGDPLFVCRPFEKKIVCKPNSCGANTKCEAGYDRSNQERAVCTCLPGYMGDPFTGCLSGECIDDTDCFDHQTCVKHKCIISSKCATDLECPDQQICFENKCCNDRCFSHLVPFLT